MLHRFHRPLVVGLTVLAVAALAACGGGSTGGSASSTPAKDSARPAADRFGLLRPTALVLQSDDVGAGYLVEPTSTRRVTLKDELRHESAKARKADRRAFVGGYTATYVKPGAAGVVSQAIVYRDAAAARIVSTDRTGSRYAMRSLHAHAIKAPRSAPGQPRLTIQGITQGLRLYAYGWQQGKVINLVVIFGRHVTVSQLVKLARTQDRHLTHPTFGT